MPDIQRCNIGSATKREKTHIEHEKKKPKTIGGHKEGK